MKIILTFFVFLLSVYSTFADVKLGIKTDSKKYDIEENIILKINISSDENVGEVKINGLDNFQVVGQRQSQQNYDINGKVTNSVDLTLKLLAKKSGEYVIGPVITKTKDGEIKSEIVKIKITGERIMVNNAIQDDEDEEEDDEKQDLSKINLNNSVSDKQEKFEKKKIIGIDGKEMTDIYPQKDFLVGNVFSKASIYILGFLLILIILGNFAYKYFSDYLFKLNKKVEEKIVERKEKIRKKTNFKKVLKELKEDFIEEEKEIFYGKFGDIFRKFLDEKLKEGLSKKSFTEFINMSTEGFNPLLSSKIKNIRDLYKKIYYPEYNKAGDNLEIREDLIEKFKKLLKN